MTRVRAALIVAVAAAVFGVAACSSGGGPKEGAGADAWARYAKDKWATLRDQPDATVAVLGAQICDTLASGTSYGLVVTTLQQPLPGGKQMPRDEAEAMVESAVVMICPRERDRV